MKTLRLLGRCFMRTMSLTSFFALFILTAAYLSSPDATPSIYGPQFFLILFYGLIAGFAFEIIRLRKLPLSAKVSIHYVILLLSVLAICIASDKIALSFVPIIVFALIFTLLYAVVMSIILLIYYATGIYKKEMSYIRIAVKQETEYKKRFK